MAATSAPAAVAGLPRAQGVRSLSDRSRITSEQQWLEIFPNRSRRRLALKPSRRKSGLVELRKTQAAEQRVLEHLLRNPRQVREWGERNVKPELDLMPAAGITVSGLETEEQLLRFYAGQQAAKVIDRFRRAIGKARKHFEPEQLVAAAVALEARLFRVQPVAESFEESCGALSKTLHRWLAYASAASLLSVA